MLTAMKKRDMVQRTDMVQCVYRKLALVREAGKGFPEKGFPEKVTTELAAEG